MVGLYLQTQFYKVDRSHTEVGIVPQRSALCSDNFSDAQRYRLGVNYMVSESNFTLPTRF